MTQSDISSREPVRPDWWTLAIGLSAFALNLFIWQALRQHQAASIQQVLESEIQRRTDAIENETQNVANALVRMANRLAHGTYQTESQWELDARSHLEHFSGFKGMGVIDSHMKRHWVFPKRNAKYSKADLSQDPIRGAALRRALQTLKPTLTNTTDLKAGGRGFLLFIPIIKKGKAEGFLAAGFLAAAFLGAAFLAVVFLAAAFLGAAFLAVVFLAVAFLGAAAFLAVASVFFAFAANNGEAIVKAIRANPSFDVMFIIFSFYFLYSLILHRNIY